MTALQNLFDAIWGNPTLLWSLGLVSLFSFVASLFLIPFLVVRIPYDYFSESKRQPAPWAERHVVVRCVVLMVKNLLGMIFVLLGLAMLVLPGQGLLTLLIGVLLLNFPGKYRFERWLIQKPSVNKAVAWLRRRAGRKPLEF
jgi:membrane protein YdbS with pleckstrin-like domain